MKYGNEEIKKIKIADYLSKKLKFQFDSDNNSVLMWNILHQALVDVSYEPADIDFNLPPEKLKERLGRERRDKKEFLSALQFLFGYKEINVAEICGVNSSWIRNEIKKSKIIDFEDAKGFFSSLDIKEKKILNNYFQIQNKNEKHRKNKDLNDDAKGLFPLLSKETQISRSMIPKIIDDIFYKLDFYFFDEIEST